MNEILISIIASEYFKTVLATIIGGIIGFIGALIGIAYQNKRWIFTPAIDTRTKAIIGAYNDFLDAFFKINFAANVGENEITFKENINLPIDKYKISINKIDIWVSNESSEKLREILGIFRKFSQEIYSAKGKQPHLKIEDWEKFSKSLEKMKKIVSYEIRSKDLRKFIFQQKFR